MNQDYENLDVEWTLVDGEGLVRVIPTDSFRAGVAIVAQLAELAEQQSHEPDVRLTNHKVVVTLYSRDESAVTERDYTYARSVDELFAAENQ